MSHVNTILYYMALVKLCRELQYYMHPDSIRLALQVLYYNIICLLWIQ